MNKKLFTQLMAAALLAPTAWAQSCPSLPTAERFTISGAEVTDKRTGLTWKRCSEGQTWSGTTCTGSATAHTHESALALAKAANISGDPTGWRLPNVKELAGLVDKGCQGPAIDRTAFPVTYSYWYWSSSPNVGDSRGAWVVYFHSGHVSYGYGRSGFSLLVRLVRASQ